SKTGSAAAVDAAGGAERRVRGSNASNGERKYGWRGITVEAAAGMAKPSGDRPVGQLKRDEGREVRTNRPTVGGSRGDGRRSVTLLMTASRLTRRGFTSNCKMPLSIGPHPLGIDSANSSVTRATGFGYKGWQSNKC